MLSLRLLGSVSLARVPTPTTFPMLAGTSSSGRKSRSAAVTEGERRGLSAAPLMLSRMLVLIAVVAQVWVAWRFWATTWDDSAITLGFARTFAQTGRIEPTPGSGIVEGYSTTLWMLLMTIAAKLVTTPSALLVTAKLASLTLNVANILLMRRWFAAWNGEALANLVAGSVGCGLMFAETINGMETPLVLTLVLGMLLLRERGGGVARTLYLALGVALLLTRFEAAWLLVPFVLVESGVRRAVTTSGFWLCALVASNLARWRYFGSLLPNTILAKRGVPYSSPSLQVQIQRHVEEPLLLLWSCKVLIAIVLLSSMANWMMLGRPRPTLTRGYETLRASWQLRFTCMFVVFSLVLTTAIGPNWGPAFRSFFAAWPFLLCLLMLPVAAMRSRLRVWTMLAIGLLALVHLRNQVQELGVPEAPFYMPGTTIENVFLMNNVLADLQNASHHQDLLFAGPDMGAIMLYSRHVRVLDLGLLCDGVLARRRYAAVKDYVLEQRTPDVIEVHRFWTTLTDLEHLELFRRRYVPVYVDGVRVFVRRDLVASIDPGRLAGESFDRLGNPASSETGHSGYIRYEKADYALNRVFREYLVLK